MRGTHHVMAAEDVSWLTGLCSHRARSGVAKRRAALGLTLDDVLRAGAALVGTTADPERLPEHVAEKSRSLRRSARCRRPVTVPTT